jgi:hypothetical protein
MPSVTDLTKQSMTKTWLILDKTGKKHTPFMTKRGQKMVASKDYIVVERFITNAHRAADIPTHLPGAIKMGILCGHTLEFCVMVAYDMSIGSKPNTGLIALLSSILMVTDPEDYKRQIRSPAALIWIQRTPGYVASSACEDLETAQVDPADDLIDAIVHIIEISNRNSAKRAQLLIGMGYDVQKLIEKTPSLAEVKYMFCNTMEGEDGEPQVIPD